MGRIAEQAQQPLRSMMRKSFFKYASKPLEFMVIILQFKCEQSKFSTRRLSKKYKSHHAERSLPKAFLRKKHEFNARCTLLPKAFLWKIRRGELKATDTNFLDNLKSHVHLSYEHAPIPEFSETQ